MNRKQRRAAKNNRSKFPSTAPTCSHKVSLVINKATLIKPRRYTANYWQTSQSTPKVGITLAASLIKNANGLMLSSIFKSAEHRAGLR